MSTTAFETQHVARAFDVHPLTPRVGAEVRGIQLRGDLDSTLHHAIYEALLRHKVLFFRKQHLNDAAHEAFARNFGELVPHPTISTAEGSKYILNLDSEYGGRVNYWHTDVTFLPNYFKLSVLRGVTIPIVGGDTIWANTHTAYLDLPAAIQNLAENLWALHSNLPNSNIRFADEIFGFRGERARKYLEEFTSTIYQTEHPVVHVHPETSEKHLLLGGFLQGILGYIPTASAYLYDLLQGYVTRPENTVRWRWQEGDVVIWDNRATQHYAVNDYGTAHRVVRRITVVGDAPTSVSGRKSVLRAKERLTRVET
jgi:taurine dioxygenase